MITTAIQFPTGAGARKSIWPQALWRAQERGGRLTIIAAVPELVEQWSRMAPSVEATTPLKWLKKQDHTANDVILVDEMADYSKRTIVDTLHAIDAEVWLVNWGLPKLGNGSNEVDRAILAANIFKLPGGAQ